MVIMDNIPTDDDIFLDNDEDPPFYRIIGVEPDNESSTEQ